MSFANLGLSDPIFRAVKEKGYSTPSPIQAEAIPAVLSGRDLLAAAQTGTGKTAGFTLPMLEILNRAPAAKARQARALVLTPTRELAAQVADSVSAYGKYLALRSAVVFGGVKINPQIAILKQGVDILVATPGRLLDLHQQGAVTFDQLEMLVLDEADRMLDMGFIHDIRKILKLLPAKRQNLLFSATFSNDIRALAKSVVTDALEVSVAPPNSTAASVEQWISPVDKKRKAELLIRLTMDNDWQQVLVFSRTKHGANRLAKQLDAAGIRAAAIHGNKSQGARTKALADFKRGAVRVLVATDIAARGLDIDQLPQVVNFDLPNVPEDYVHRIGRTGRAGATGQAVSLVSADEIKQLSDIEKLIKKRLPRRVMDDFEPDHQLPESAKPSAPANKPSGRSAKPGSSPASKRGRASRQNAARPAQGQKSASAKGQERGNNRTGGANANRSGGAGQKPGGAGQKSGGGRSRRRPVN